MNYQVRAIRLIPKGMNTTTEDYEKDVLNYDEGEKEALRLKSLGDYVHIYIYKKIKNNFVQIEKPLN